MLNMQNRLFQSASIVLVAVLMEDHRRGYHQAWQGRKPAFSTVIHSRNVIVASEDYGQQHLSF
jgi:hypothetical protein